MESDSVRARIPGCSGVVRDNTPDISEIPVSSLSPTGDLVNFQALSAEDIRNPYRIAFPRHMNPIK